eukprot:GHVP01053672.1.p1 GENE.GHVP01053672.1~~GHVP01053672.1.p1  ORF type:complete len:607 (+),score=110.07 GHVP01053672.1:35-1822(+)
MTDFTFRIFCGTETGTAWEASLTLAAEVRRVGIPVELLTFDQCTAEDFHWKSEIRPVVVSEQTEDLDPGKKKNDSVVLSAPHIQFKETSPKYMAIIVSTAGVGEFPSHCRNIWQKLLRLSNPKDMMSGIRFSVFGLGDSRYQEFNFAARKIRTRLLSLSAVEFHRMALGDEQHDFAYCGEFDPWVDEIVEKLIEIYNVPKVPNINQEDPHQVIPDYEVIPVANLKDESFLTKPSSLDSTDVDDEYQWKLIQLLGGPQVDKFTILQNNRITAPEHHQDVRSIRMKRMSVDGAEKRYMPGDILTIFPETPAETVDLFLSDMKLDPKFQAKIERSARSLYPDSPFPNNEVISLRNIFRYILNIQVVPNRNFFRLVAPFATVEAQKEKLLEFAGRTLENKVEYFTYCVEEKRTIAEVFWDFYSCRPPIPVLLSAIPPFLPRRYSISTAPHYLESRYFTGNSHPKECLSPIFARPCLPSPYLANLRRRMEDETRKNLALKPNVPEESLIFELAVAVVDYHTKNQRHIRGLCSNFLASLYLGKKIFARIDEGITKQASIRNDRPLIVVAHGTGIAPAKAILEERSLLRRRGTIIPRVLNFR